MSDDHELFRAEDGCDRLLPTGSVESRISYYRVTTFEYEALLDELFGRDAWLDASVSPDRRDEPVSLSLALPLAYYASSDLIHEATVARRIEAEEHELAALNDGTFLPMPKGVDFEDRALRPVVRVDDLKELERGGLDWRGRRIPVDASLRDALLEDGHAFVEMPARSGGRARRAKVVLGGRRVEIDGTGNLAEGKAIDIGGARRRIDLPPRALERLRAGRSAHALAGDELVHLVPRRRARRRPPAARTPAPFARIATPATGGGLEDVFHCMRVAAVLNDPRAGALHIASPDLPKAENVPDEEYHVALGEVMADPRTEACIAKLRRGATGGLEAGAPGLPKYELGLVTTYDQDWELLGYSRGALLSSINLAPEEELTIEVFTWDRRRLSQEQEFASEYEFSRSVTSNTNAAVTIARDLKESLSGDLNFDGRIGLPVKKVKVDAGVDGGVAGSVDETLASNVELIRDTTATSGEKFRATHRMQIRESSETGTENRITRRIRNPNLGRTLTFNYFEILENYRVRTRVRPDGSRMCVLVPNPDLGPFDLDFVLAHQHRIGQVLLGASYRRGLEAAPVLAANRWFEEQSAITEEANRPVTQPTTAAPAAEPPPQPAAEKPRGIFATGETIHRILDHFINELDVGNALSLLWDHVAPIGGGSFSLGEVQEARTAIKKYCYWYKIINIYPGFEEQARIYLDRTAGKFGPRQHEPEIIAELGALTAFFDDDWLASVKMFAASTVVQAIMKLPILLTGPAAPFIGSLLEPIVLDLAYNHDDRGLSNAISKVRRDIQAVVDTQNAVIAQDQVEMPAAADIVPAARPQVPQAYSLRELAEAHAHFRQLTTHMEEHRTYYANEIWRAEDANERIRRLELLGLARHVENRLLGFAGDSAILPLQLSAFPEELRDALAEFLRPPRENADGSGPARHHETAEQEISVPTPGLHMETLLGRCDALEPYLIERRGIDQRVAEAQAAAAEERLRQQRIETERQERTLARDLPEPPADDGTAPPDGG